MALVGLAHSVLYDRLNHTAVAVTARCNVPHVTYSCAKFW